TPRPREFAHNRVKVASGLNAIFTHGSGVPWRSARPTLPAMPPESLRVAMVGTRGVPARYGGFETAVEEIGARLADRGHAVRVYCRTAPDAQDQPAPATYRGMELVTLPAMRRRSLETLSHTALSVAHLVRHRTDVAFVFNAANAPLL